MTDKPNTYVGLDMGGSRTRCVIAQREAGELRYLSCGSMPPLRWQGENRAPQLTAEAVSEAVLEAEGEGGLTVVSAVVGIGGASVRSNLVHTAVTLPRGAGIGLDDVRNAVAKAERGLLDGAATTLQLVPLEFLAGRQSGLQNLLGRPAERLEAYVRLISIRAEEHGRVQRLINGTSIQVAETIFSGFASAYATLREAERADGVAHLEIGKASSGLTVYCGGGLRLACGIPVGRDRILDDVTRAFAAERDVASSLIDDFGGAARDLETEQRAYLRVPSRDSRFRKSAGRPWPRQMLNKIIVLRLQECLELASDELRHERLTSGAVKSLVVSGDLAALPGMAETAEAVVGLPARVGLPSGLTGLPPALRHPGWASAAGLVLYADRLAYRPPDEPSEELVLAGARDQEDGEQ